MNRQSRINILLLGLALLTFLAAILLQKPFETYAGRPIFRGETALYRYTGEGLDSGDILVSVDVDLDNPKALEAYREANVARGRALIARGKAKPIWVQVTFARPLPADEVRTLVRETGFQVENYLMVGRASNGERVFRIQVGTIGDDVPETAYEPLWNVKMTFAGIMLLQGTIETTKQGLGRWLTDERVYIIDTTGEEVRELAAQRHANIVAGRNIVFSLESPFWDFDW